LREHVIEAVEAGASRRERDALKAGNEQREARRLRTRAAGGPLDATAAHRDARQGVQRTREGAFSFQIRGRLPRRLFLRPATFLPLLVDTLSIFLVVALPPSKDLFPVRLIPACVIGTALKAAFLALAFVIGNTMLAVLGAPCLEIGAAPLPLLRCQRLSAH
jgi:hypothetical protein